MFVAAATCDLLPVQLKEKVMRNLRPIGSPIGTWLGIFAVFAIVLGGLVHAGAADPSGHAELSAAHESLIPPFRD
jgi:hypothetical protein